MGKAVAVSRLASGLYLNRHADPDFGILDAQCGTEEYWSNLCDEVRRGPLAYYNKADGHHKLLEKVTLNVYSPHVPMPEVSGAYAYTYGRTGQAGWAPGTSEVFLPYAAGDPYLTAAVFAHELGHCFDGWIGCHRKADINAAWGALWQRAISSNHSLLDATLPPWQRESLDGVNRVEHPHETFANSFRFFFGTMLTRGVSGPGTREPVPSGFEHPEHHAEWGRMLAILPETCAFIQRFGIWPGTLEWAWDNGFRFRRSDGVWVAHWHAPNDYWLWFEYKNDAWQRYYPRYDRF